MTSKFEREAAETVEKYCVAVSEKIFSGLLEDLALEMQNRFG